MAPPPEEPAWPQGDGPYVVLLDALGPLERRLLRQWIGRRRPPATRVDVFAIPPSRRRSGRGRLDPRLEARLDADDDPLCVPLRIVWLAPRRGARRRVTFRDLLVPGDPRDPDPLRQRVILARHPDRCRIVVGNPARLSELRHRWAAPRGHGPADGTPLAEFVVLQARLALERAERRLRGNRYKVPRFVREELLASRDFQRGVAHLALEESTSIEAMYRRTSRYLREIAATHSPYVIDLVTGLTGWVLGKAHRHVDYDPEALRRVYRDGERHPLVFLPSHKSNLDHLVLQYVLYENAFPPNHTAAGRNMNFFPIGPLIRRTGTFFIRREFKGDRPYIFVLRQYVEYLLEKRFSLEWYVEGGRSRTGKLRRPRLGLLRYVVDTYRKGLVEDVVLVPVSIAYDQIIDVGTYTAEQRGGRKERESLVWVVRMLRSLRPRYGDVHLRIGRPVSIARHIPADVDLDTGEGRALLPALAVEVCRRINEVTPVTPISVVATVLLGHGGRGLTADDVARAAEPFLHHIARRDLPATSALRSGSVEPLRDALDALAASGVVTRHEGLTETVYALQPDQFLAVAYYRNTVVHFFVDTAVVELALAALGDRPRADVDGFGDEVEAICDLLAWEFFFPDDRREQALEQLTLAGAREALDAGRLDAALAALGPPLAPFVLRPFLEAYRIVADVLERVSGPITEEEAVRRALALGEQYRLQGRVTHPEAVSTALFGTAVQLAAARGALAGEEARHAFAVEVSRYLVATDRLAKGLEEARTG